MNKENNKCARCGLSREKWNGRWQALLCKVDGTTYDLHKEVDGTTTDHLDEEHEKKQKEKEMQKTLQNLSDGSMYIVPPSDFLKKWSKNTRCLHKSCKLCNGTGQKLDGRGFCVHSISCPCENCSTSC